MKRMLIAVMCVCVISSVVSAGVITSGIVAPTDVFASGAVDGGNYTRVFDVDANANHARGGEIKSDSGDSYAGYTMTALSLRKKSTQDFTGTTAFLTLHVFEGTAIDYASGDGDGDGSIWDKADGSPFTTTVYTETFALTGSYADLEYVTFNLDTAITMAENMSFVVLYDQGTSGNTYFQIAQRNNVEGGDGRSFQLTPTSQASYPSPQEYYAVGTVPEPATMALLGLGSLVAIRRKKH